MKEKIICYINENKKWLFDTLMDIISKDTINRMPSGNENNGQDLIESIFKEIGLEIDRFSPDEIPALKKHPAYLEGRDYSNRDNIVGFKGSGNKKTIIFSGHVDTVPTEKLNWEKTGPLTPKMIGDRIYGMGALDMKGGLLSSIFALKTIIDLDIAIAGKVILESVVDEEFAGANGTLACIERGYEGDFAIIPEPSNMDIYPVLISQSIFDVFVKGKEGLGVDSCSKDPVFLAAELISALLDYEGYLNTLKSKSRLYKDYDKPIVFTCAAISAGKMDDDELFTAPPNCQFRICIRNYSDCHDEEGFNNSMFDFLKKYKKIKRNIENGNIIFEKKYRFFPGTEYRFVSEANRSFIDRLHEISHLVLNKRVREVGGQYAGDLFMFNNFSNTPAVVYGPGGGGIHAANEYVNVDDIVNLSKIFALFIYNCCC